MFQSLDLTAKKWLAVFLALLLCWWLFGSSCHAQTPEKQITISADLWQNLKTELTALNQELILCQNELITLKRPSQELVTELTQAKNMLGKLQQELTACKEDLTALHKEAEESKILLKKLREQIDKEKRIHKRQVIQSRIWGFVAGICVGVIASR